MPFIFNKFSLKVFVIVILIVGIIIAVVLSGQRQSFKNFASQKGTTIALVPNWIVGEVNQKYEIQITINTGEDSITAAQIHLRYDPKKLEIIDIKSGSFLSAMVGNSIDSGIASALFITSPENPQKGFGNLGTLEVRLLDQEGSEIRFTQDSRITAAGKSSNSLETAIGTRLIGSSVFSDLQKRGIGEYPVPSAVVFLNPDPYVRDFWETPPPAPFEKAKTPSPAFSIEYIDYLFNLPLEEVKKLNQNLQNKASKYLENRAKK